jgi:hypothetical protein
LMLWSWCFVFALHFVCWACNSQQSGVFQPNGKADG